MNEADKGYIQAYNKAHTPQEEEEIPDDTLAVWLTGITAVVSAVGMVVWIVSLL